MNGSGNSRLPDELHVLVDASVIALQRHGGISRIYREIIPRMCEIDRQLHIGLATWVPGSKDPPSHPRVRQYRVPNSYELLRPWRLWKNTFSSAQSTLEKLFLKNSEAQVFHSTYYRIFPFLDTPMVLSVYDMIYEKFALEYFPEADEFREQKRRAILLAEVIITITEATRRDLIDLYGVNERKVRVVHLGCGEDFILGTEISKLSAPKKPYLMYVGSRQLYKGFDTLLDAYASWPRKSDLRLLVVGEPWTEAERKALSDLKLANQVDLIRSPDDKTLAQLYRSSVALVYPSRYEGFGLPLLEAMACGCSIVASRIPSSVEVAENCPIYFDPGDPGELRDALDEVLSIPLERINEGIRLARSYSWSTTARKTAEIYREVASS